jgi:ATP-dependent DNA helicase RecQ
MRTALKQYFGYDVFLDGQEGVVEQILDGRDLCVVMPTGAGKSLCYQLPILMRPGYGLVVSPLISLMKDQVDALQARNVPAAYINSSVTGREQQRLAAMTARGEVKILYVAPERFRVPGFLNLLREHPPSLLVVDEAHCISQWGHDFRPDYLKLGQVVSQLEIPQVCAFTATATPQVRDDICANLQRPDMLAVVSGFQRPNLSFSVLNCQSNKDKLNRLGQLLETRKPTIIYTATRKAVDEIAGEFECIAYHAGLSDQARNEAQEHFMNDECPVLVATNAFGMGIDRPDVRRVIHYNMPGSLEAYYQEAGRAGRDGAPAECILLFAYQDRFVQEFLIDMNNPPQDVVRHLYAALCRESRQRSGQPLEHKLADLQESIGAKSDKHISSALMVLEKHGLVERGYRRQNAGLLRFLGDLESLRLVHQHESTQRSRLIYRCILAYGAALGEGVRVTYEHLSMATGLNLEQIKRVLRALQGEALDWEPPFAGRTIQVLNPEVSTLDVDFSALEKKRDFEIARLDQVQQYAREHTCRQRFLVAYFGQHLDDWRCGCCDLCQRQSSGRAPDASEMVRVKQVLETVLELKGRFGRVRVAQVLSGSRQQEILKSGLNRSPHYGRLDSLGQSGVMRLLDALQAADCLMTVGDPQYPRIDISRRGIEVLDGRCSLQLDLPASGRNASTRVSSSGSQSPQAADDDLLERLRGLRRDLAAKKNVPAYYILTDESLRELALNPPVTPEESLRIKGIGKLKARTLIPIFLKEISCWRKSLDG